MGVYYSVMGTCIGMTEGVWCLCGCVVFVWAACLHCTPVRLPPFTDFSSYVNLALSLSRSLSLPLSLSPPHSLTPCLPASLPAPVPPFSHSRLAFVVCRSSITAAPEAARTPPRRISENQRERERECDVLWYSIPIGSDDSMGGGGAERELVSLGGTQSSTFTSLLRCLGSGVQCNGHLPLHIQKDAGHACKIFTHTLLAHGAYFPINSLIVSLSPSLSLIHSLGAGRSFYSLSLSLSHTQ